MPATITGNIKDLAGVASTAGITVDFTLLGYNDNPPRVNNTALIAPSVTGFVYTATPNGSGAISISLYGGDEISAGGQTGVTFYQVTVKRGNQNNLYSAQYTFNSGNTYDLTTATPITTAPVVAAPTGDTTYARLDGGNQPFTGNVSMNGTLIVTGATTLSSTLGVTGLSTLGNVKVNPVATGTNAALTVGGTSSTTGGLSVFVGALGAQNERLAVVPADGSAAAARCGALSVRLLSAGFLAGSQVAGISSTGVLSISTTTGTLPATINNDTAGGITFTNNAGGSFQFGNGGTLFLNVLGGAIRWSGATSGTTVLQATAIAGGNILTLPPTVNDTLVGKTTTDTFTNKTLTGVTSGNTVSVLNAQGAVAALTGNSADQVVYTFTLLANTVDTTSKGILVTCGLTHNSGTANPSVKININGVAAVTGNIGTTASQSVTMETKILRTASTTGGSIGKATSSGNLVPFSQALTGLAWGSNQTITVTFNVANTDQMTGVAFLVEQIQ